MPLPDPTAQAFTLLVTPPPEAEPAVRAAVPPATKVVIIDGRACPSEPQAFEALAAAFSFPDWFGANWDAAEELLRDLSWLDTDSFALVVRDANWLLAEEPNERLKICTEVLAAVSRSWRGDPRSRPPDPPRGAFGTVLHASEQDVDTMVARYRSVGVDLDR